MLSVLGLAVIKVDNSLACRLVCGGNNDAGSRINTLLPTPVRHVPVQLGHAHRVSSRPFVTPDLQLHCRVISSSGVECAVTQM